MTCGVQKMCNTTKTNGLNLAIMEQEPKDLKTAQVIIDELRNRCRTQAEQIMKWKKAYAIQVQQHYRYQKDKTDQMNNLTSQLLLLESRLKRKQKQIANIICHRELTIIRQQKLIDALSSRLVDHGLDTLDPSYTDFDSLNDSDSAVVLEDIDSDCNSSFSMRRKSSCGGGGINSGDVTIVRSISDAIETNLNKYGGGCGGGGGRRSNCYLRRPDILETVYSVEEDPEPSTQQQQQQQQQDQHQQKQLSQQQDVSEKRDKFRNRSDKAITDHYIDGLQTQCNNTDLYYKNFSSPPSPYHYHNIITENNYCNSGSSTINKQQSQVTNFNRVMSNHRSVTKPKDVKYKRINKAKSKSLEELRGRLKNWVERGAVCSGNSNNADNNKCSMNNINNITGNSNNSGIGNNKISNSITDTNLPQIAQSYA